MSKFKTTSENVPLEESWRLDEVIWGEIVETEKAFKKTLSSVNSDISKRANTSKGPRK